MGVRLPLTSEKLLLDVEQALTGYDSPTMQKQSPADRALIAIISIGALARLALAAAIGLGIDESYAVTVAQPVALGYYDHPPLVFWITALIERLGGGQSDVMLRLPFILLFAATTFLVHRLTRALFDDRAALYAAILLQII